MIQKRANISPLESLLLDENLDYAKIVTVIKRERELFPEPIFQETVETGRGGSYTIRR